MTDRRIEDDRTLSPGERMVWAAEFVRTLADDKSSHEAARRAGRTIIVMRSIGDSLDRESRIMLDDMLGRSLTP